MLSVSEMALRKVRNNIDRLFDKNLTDLIRGIRNNKENEARYITACIEEIKTELKQDSIFIKTNAIEKLAYLQMLGYDISWASFNIIEVMASTRHSEKRIGYLAATQCFSNDTDVLMLTTNLIRKDLQSANMYDVGVALSGLACFATPDLARDLVNDVVVLLSSSRPYVRKKAVLLLYKIFLKYPESLRPTFSRLRDKLEDPNPGVQSAAVNVVCELARKNPRNYLSLHEVFFRLMNNSSNNWMLIKIIKLFGSLVPLESNIGKKLLEPLTNLINSTSAMSLLYECINTVIAVLISISSEGPGDYSSSIQLCVQKLGVLIEDSDQNLKYLGLLAMGRILLTHPKAVQAHKDIVLRCLNDKDESIRLRALDLLYGMVSKKNIMEIVKKLMEHVDAAEGSFYRDELLSRIISICSHNNYQYITNFEWYISVLVELTKVEGSKHGVLIAEQIQDVTVRVQSIRHFSVSQMALLVQNAQLLLSGNSAQRNNICAVLLAAAWICGEYAEHVNDIPAVLESMNRIKMSVVPGELLSVYIQNIAKLYSFLLNRYESEQDWDSVESLDNLLVSKLPEFQYSDHLEAQERACNLVELVKVCERAHFERRKIGDQVARLFEGELNPVAAKAQRRVPIPEGLDLDAWINEPEETDEEDEDESATFSSSSAAETTPIRSANGSLAKSAAAVKRAEPAKPKQRSEAELQREIEESRRRRKFEQANNPYYVKSTGDTSSALRLSGSGSSVANLAGRPCSALSAAATARNASAGDLAAAASDLQSPLEIPGVIGLDRYLKQQESTLSWENAVKVGGKSKSKKKKRSKRGEDGKSEGKRRGRRGQLSILSSSDDESESVGGHGAVVHHVNRDDGEMPDGALSSDADVEHLNGVGDEFRALDINLDEPLRDDEKLFAPTPYRTAERLNVLATAAAAKSPKKSKRKKADTAVVAEEKPKKVEKKKKKNPAVEKMESTEKSPKKSGKDRLEHSDSADYTVIKSTVKGQRHAKEAKESSQLPIISLSDVSAEPTLDEACFSGATAAVAKKPLKKRKSQKSAAAAEEFAHGYESLAENEHLKLQYTVKSVEAAVGLTADVSLAFVSRCATTAPLRDFRIFMLESGSIRLDRDKSEVEKDIRLAFDKLPAKACAEHTLRFVIEEVDVTQRVRGSLTYFADRQERVLNFVIRFPALKFLQFATIGSTSYEIILSSGELKHSTQKQCTSSLPLGEICDAICQNANFSVVLMIEEAVSLYAHDATHDHICVLIKRAAVARKPSSLASGSPTATPAVERRASSDAGAGDTVVVSVKCVQSLALASTIADEICERITALSV